MLSSSAIPYSTSPPLSIFSTSDLDGGRFRWSCHSRRFVLVQSNRSDFSEKLSAKTFRGARARARRFNVSFQFCIESPRRGRACQNLENYFFEFIFWFIEFSFRSVCLILIAITFIQVCKSLNTLFQIYQICIVDRDVSQKIKNFIETFKHLWKKWIRDSKRGRNNY